MKSFLPFLLVLSFFFSFNFLSADNNYTAIWFLDGSIIWNPRNLVIDSVNNSIYYHKNFNSQNKKTAYFNEVFALTSNIDTMYFYFDKQWNLSHSEVFSIIKGINSGFRTKHYTNIIVSFFITYGSNILLYKNNVIVKNIPSVINLLIVAMNKVETEEKSSYEVGYEIGLKRRKVVETTVGIVLGLYAYMGTKAVLTSGN